MIDRSLLSRKSQPAVLSLAAQANLQVTGPAKQDQFRLLVRHLLGRFFHNEMVSAGGETLPLLMTIAYIVALPTLLAALYSFPAYHAFPPYPPKPTFWVQAIDHYFFVMYSWVVMGAVTVFEWDLLFPSSLDVLVLSVMPIPAQRLLLARATAVLIFLGLFLLATASLGIVFFPPATDLPQILRLLLAHAVAVIVAGVCAASQVLALQGMLLTLLGARLFQKISTFLQSVSMAVLLIVLFVFPVLSRSLPALIHSQTVTERSFPPFWFLGIYETILAGRAALPEFIALAHIGFVVTVLLILVTVITYPVAHRRRTIQVLEGSVSPKARSRWIAQLTRLMHIFLVRTPKRRAVFHFMSQTLLRTPRHRVYLAMYAGLGIALITAGVITIGAEGGHLAIGVSPWGLRAAVPALTFWTVAGLCTALASPADPAGRWLFRVIHDRPHVDHLVAARTWVLLWSLAITSAVLLALHLISPAPLRTPQAAAGQLLMAAGLCLLLSDAFFLQHWTIPFTEARVPRNTDLAFLLLRYILLFPALVLTSLHYEPWIEATWVHLGATAIVIGLAHLSFRSIHLRRSNKQLSRNGDEGEEPFQTLGLRN